VAETDENLRRQPAQGRSAQRLELILDTAATLIDEVGLTGTTPSLIARSSGMSGPAIYRYFDSMDAIVRALATRNLERFLTTVEQLLSDEEITWEQAVAGTVEAYAEMFRSEPGFRDVRLWGGPAARLAESVSNKSIVATSTIGFFQPRFDAWDRPDFRLRIEAMIEIIEALVSHAFESDESDQGYFISEAKRVAIEYLGDFLTTVPGTPRAAASAV
jgi:AcrR family transcriptional regulator